VKPVTSLQKADVASTAGAPPLGIAEPLKLTGSQTLPIRVWDPITLANQDLPLSTYCGERQYNHQSALPIPGRPSLGR
jgi:hypothetical protein